MLSHDIFFIIDIFNHQVHLHIIFIVLNFRVLGLSIEVLYSMEDQDP
jgi:hypothetical protein